MVLGKLPLPGRPTTVAYSACSRCGWGCLDILSLVCHFSLLSLSLSGRRPDIVCNTFSKGRKSQNNQPTNCSALSFVVGFHSIRTSNSIQFRIVKPSSSLHDVKLDCA